MQQQNIVVFLHGKDNSARTQDYQDLYSHELDFYSP